MQLLLDENVSQTIGHGLRRAGFRIFVVMDVGLSGASDSTIITFAKKRRLTIITHDKDLGNLIRFPIQAHAGVIVLRFRNQKPQNVLPHLMRFLSKQRNLKSKLVILHEDGFRIVQ